MASEHSEEARVAWRSYHDWVLPRRAVLAILTGSLLFVFLGLLLLAIGGGLGVGGLVATGAVLAGIGGCGILVCLMLCLHAYFVFNVRDEAVQTSENPWSDDISPQEIPGYAVINKPSALKSADSTLKRNGGGMKKVTMAPDVALDADRAPALHVVTSGSAVDGGHAQIGRFSPTPASPSTPGYRTIGNYAVIDTATPTPAPSSPMESYDQRSFAQQQAFQSLQQQQQAQQFQNLQHQQQQAQQFQNLQQQQQQAQQFQSLQHQQQQQRQQGQVFQSQRQRDDLDIQHQRQQLEIHRQHLLQQQQQQQQQLHPQHFRVAPQGGGQAVTYAQIQRVPVPVQHSPSPSLGSQQSSSIVSNYGSSLTGGGGVVAGGGGGVSGGSVSGGGLSAATSSLGKESSSSFTHHKIQTQGLNYQSGRPYFIAADDDYDNPVEHTPMLSQSSASASSSSRVVGGSAFAGSRMQSDADVPEPSPLVYPSARRPMTFEQQSSSKMSIYDNVLFPYAEKDE